MRQAARGSGRWPLGAAAAAGNCPLQAHRRHCRYSRRFPCLPGARSRWKWRHSRCRPARRKRRRHWLGACWAVGPAWLAARRLPAAATSPPASRHGLTIPLERPRRCAGAAGPWGRRRHAGRLAAVSDAAAGPRAALRGLTRGSDPRLRCWVLFGGSMRAVAA